MSMYRSYLLKNEFWAKKGNEKNPNGEKVFIKHDLNGAVYAIISPERKGVKIISDSQEYFFSNFDKLDLFLNRQRLQQQNFVKIVRRQNISKQLRMLDI